MKLRMAIGLLLLLFLVVGGGVSLASQSPIDSPLSTSTPYPTIVINGTRLSTRTPTPAWALSIVQTPTPQPEHQWEHKFEKTASIEPQQSVQFSRLACIVAARWWSFSESLCD